MIEKGGASRSAAVKPLPTDAFPIMPRAQKRGGKENVTLRFAIGPRLAELPEGPPSFFASPPPFLLLTENLERRLLRVLFFERLGCARLTCSALFHAGAAAAAG